MKKKLWNNSKTGISADRFAASLIGLGVPEPETTVCPPWKDNDKRYGTFATRSPNRPSPIGLTRVKLHRLEGERIYTGPLDLFDGTPKFISAEGGWRWIVWMNHSLREELRPALEALAAKAGIHGFVDMIASEQNAVGEEEILFYLETAGHPTLVMDPMM